MFSSHPVKPADTSPPDSVSRGGSAGVPTPPGERFLGRDSTEIPWSAVSVLEQSVDEFTHRLLISVQLI